MHVCTCENQSQLLSIEERIEGVRKVFCESFASCGEKREGVKKPEAFPPETSGLVYLKAVNDHVKRQHALELAGATPIRAPSVPLPAVLAPQAERSNTAPLLALVGLLSLGLAVLTVEYSRSGDAARSAEPAVSLAAAGLGAPGGSLGEGGAGGALQGSVALASLSPQTSAEEEAAGGELVLEPVELTLAGDGQGDRQRSDRLDGMSDRRSRADRRRRADRRERRRARQRRQRSEREAARKEARPSISVHEVLARAAGPHGGLVSDPVASGAASPKAAAKAPSLKEMLSRAAVKAEAEKAPLAAAPKLPERPSLAAIGRAASKLRARAGSCLKQFGFAHLTVRVRLGVNGRTGRVTSARVLGRLHGTPAGNCIQSRAQGVRFGRFAAAKHVVTLPVRVH